MGAVELVDSVDWVVDISVKLLEVLGGMSERTSRQRTRIRTNFIKAMIG